MKFLPPTLKHTKMQFTTSHMNRSVLQLILQYFDIHVAQYHNDIPMTQVSNFITTLAQCGSVVVMVNLSPS